jgi:hypothetical protein
MVYSMGAVPGGREELGGRRPEGARLQLTEQAQSTLEGETRTIRAPRIQFLDSDF